MREFIRIAAMRAVVVLLLIALVNASPQLQEQRDNDYRNLNPANDVESIDEAKQPKKRTLLGVGPYTYAAAKHVGVHPLGFKYILGYGPIGYSPYARPVTLLKPLLHTHAWKAVPIKPVHVRPVVPIVPVPHFKPALHVHRPHVHVHQHPVHPPVHHVHPVVPVQPEEPVPSVHAVQPAQPIIPLRPVVPIQPVPVEKPVVPIIPNIVKPVVQWPQLPQVPYSYPFYKSLGVPNQILPVHHPFLQHFVPQLHVQPPLLPQSPVVPHLLPQPSVVQHLLPHSLVPQVPIQPPVVQPVPQPPIVQHLLPQPAPVVPQLLPQPPIVQHLLPQPPPVVPQLLPQLPIVQHILPQPPPAVPQLLPQPPIVQHLLPQQPPVVQQLLPQPPAHPSIFHIFKQFPFFKSVTPLLPVNPAVPPVPLPDVPQAPVPPVTIHAPSTTQGSGVSVQIPLHLPEHPSFRPGVHIVPQFPSQPDYTDQEVHGQTPIDQPDFHYDQGSHVDNPFLIPQPQPQGPTHPAPQTPLYLPPHPLLRPDGVNSVQTEFSATLPKHPFADHGVQGIHHPSISLEPPYGPEHNLG